MNEVVGELQEAYEFGPYRVTARDRLLLRNGCATSRLFAPPRQDPRYQNLVARVSAGARKLAKLPQLVVK